MNAEPTFEELTDTMMAHYRAGDYVSALQVVERHADRFPLQLSRVIFWKMCLLSLCGRADDVLSVFNAGLDSGLWWAEVQFQDTDLDAVRDLPEFKRLVAASGLRYEEARRHVEREHAVLLPEAPPSGRYPLLITLHGRNGSKDSHLRYWDFARRKGWLVLLAQSTQPLSSSSYCWDDPGQGLADLEFYVHKVSEDHPIDGERVVLAGFSQGAGMAIQASATARMRANGFIGIAASWVNPNWLDSLAVAAQPLRGYFITGERDATLQRVREIQDVLGRHAVEFEEELHPDLAHDFPADFGSAFENAINFIFKEHE